MKKLTLFNFVFLLLYSNLLSQSVPSFITDSLDQYVNEALKDWQIPGAAVLIVKDGEVVIAKGYGVKEIGTNDKVDENTLFMIGSNTKAFTGTALAMLEFENKIKLTDKVTAYLPYFRLNEKWKTDEINLIDLVSHRMGFETFQGDFMYWTSDLTSDEVIEKFGRISPKYDFRTKYGYTNAGYAVAGKVIEKVSGLKWEDYIKEKIFLPLSMDRTTSLSTEYFSSQNIARPHTYVENKMSLIPFQPIDNLAPCGSIASSVKDLSHWIIAQLDSGKFGGEKILNFEVILRTREPQTIVRQAKHPFNNSHFQLYGLGWALEDYEGIEIISHTGGVNGFVTSVTLVPKEKLGIVVLTNNDQNAFYQALKWEIIDSYLGLPYRNYNNFMFKGFLKQFEKRRAQLAEWRDSIAMNFKPTIDLKEFAGRYYHEVYGYADIKIIGENLTLDLQHHSKLKAKINYIGNNRFLCTYSDPTYGIRVFPFYIENDEVKYFDLYVDNFVEFLPYRFYKQKG